jgi:hypothetical protein
VTSQNLIKLKLKTANFAQLFKFLSNFAICAAIFLSKTNFESNFEDKRNELGISNIFENIEESFKLFKGSSINDVTALGGEGVSRIL